jgi:hypothetical protein
MFYVIVLKIHVINCQGFLVLFRSTSDTIVAGMLLSLAYLKAIQWLAPFKDPVMNRIKETSLWQIFFVFFIALLIKMDDVNSDMLVVCLMLVFFANFWILLGQYLVQYCGRHLCVPDTAARRVGNNVMGAVEMQNVTTSLVLSSDKSSCLVNNDAMREGSGEDGISTVGGSGGHHVCVAASVTGPPPAVAAAGSQGQGQSSLSSDMHTAVGHTQTHSPFHPTT